MLRNERLIRTKNTHSEEERGERGWTLDNGKKGKRHKTPATHNLKR